MKMNRTVGLAIFAVGLLLLGFAFNATQTPVEEFANTLTGRYSNGTMRYFVVGLAATVGGGLIAFFGSR
ncbi:MAG: DUF3185 family protein [Magnetococcales bacterium]|nr:DUF3185 family protein [Magnetococcales bacterium]